MTILHILNYLLPISFIAFFGFMIDKMCKPVAPKEED